VGGGSVGSVDVDVDMEVCLWMWMTGWRVDWRQTSPTVGCQWHTGIPATCNTPRGPRTENREPRN